MSSLNSNNNDETTSCASARLSGLSIQERADALFRDAEILAPMVRASTTPLRTLAIQYGASLVFTEEIVDRSITTCHRVMNEQLGTIDYIKNLNEFSPKVQRRMQSTNSLPVILRIDPKIERNKLIYQIGTGEANLALPAATLVEKDVNGIDVNMGCPKKFSISGGMGSALLKDTNRACDIIKTLRRNLSIPVSAKIRLLSGENSDASVSKTIEFVQALITAGANAITIHAREVGDESTEPAKWDQLTEVVKTLKSKGVDVPITINGDLYTRKDIEEMKYKTGADGIMLARPALYNTSIFRRPPSHSKSNTPTEANGDSSSSSSALYNKKESNPWDMYSFNSPLLLPKTCVIQEYIQHSVRYDINHKNAKYVICEMMSNRRAPTILTPNLPQVYPGGQSIDKVCRCRNLDDLCKLWDVKATSITGVNGEKQQQLQLQQQQPAGEHTYSDEYFLNHEKYTKTGRMEKSQSKNDEEKKDGTDDLETEQREVGGNVVHPVQKKVPFTGLSSDGGEPDPGTVKRPRLE